VSYAIPRHAKPPRSAGKHGRAPARHRKPQAKPALVPKPALAVTIAAAVTVAGAAAAGAGFILPTKPRALTPESTVIRSVGGGATSALVSGLEMSRSLSTFKAAADLADQNSVKAAAAVRRKHHRQAPKPAPPVYVNPLRAVTGLQPQRIDMGADFAGSGPIYPIGNAVITSATSSSGGWPGGGWICYQLTDGPAAGLVVYVAEDVQPTVSVGTKVTPTTVIANMFSGGAGIETGWAMPNSASAESQLAEAGGISGGGPFPTQVGVNFDALLQALGVPAAPNAGQSAFGLLPSNYPGTWSGLH